MLVWDQGSIFHIAAGSHPVQEAWESQNSLYSSGVARAFPGGRLAHPEDQNEEENKWSLRKNKKTCSNFEEKMRKVELLLTQDCEAGYGPAVQGDKFKSSFNVVKNHTNKFLLL